MYNKLLALPSLENTRDLGGMKTADGKTVKAHRLIRSGELSRASDADLAVLSKVYGVGTVVDLRPPAEILQAIHNPLGVSTVTGVKYRTRAMMGRCQGGYCQMRITRMLEEERGLAPQEITYAREGSQMLYGLVREEAHHVEA